MPPLEEQEKEQEEEEQEQEQNVNTPRVEGRIMSAQNPPSTPRIKKKRFTTGQVAKICKVAPRTVSKWFDSGLLRGYRIPGSQDRRIPRDELKRFLKEQGMPPLDDEVQDIVLVILPQGALPEEIRTGFLLEECPELRDCLEELEFRFASNLAEAGALSYKLNPRFVLPLGNHPEGDEESFAYVEDQTRDSGGIFLTRYFRLGDGLPEHPILVPKPAPVAIFAC